MQSVVERFSDITNGINREVINSNGVQYIIYSTTIDISDKAIAKLKEVFSTNKEEPLKVICQSEKTEQEGFEGMVLYVYENQSCVHIIGENNNQYVLPFGIIETVLSNSGEVLYQKGMQK